MYFCVSEFVCVGDCLCMIVSLCLCVYAYLCIFVNVGVGIIFHFNRMCLLLCVSCVSCFCNSSSFFYLYILVHI